MERIRGNPANMHTPTANQFEGSRQVDQDVGGSCAGDGGGAFGVLQASDFKKNPGRRFAVQH